MNAYEVIRSYLSQAELLAQLAEEAAELSKAALKFRRVCDGTNPTPVTYDEALGNIKEEIADVKLLLSILGLDSNYMEISMIQAEKLVRWIDRLNKSGGKDNGTKETNQPPRA